MSLDSRTDHSTLSNCEEVVTNHISLDWDIDFSKNVIRGSATLKMTVIKSTSKILLDTSCDMSVDSVKIAGNNVAFSVLPAVAPFGSPLEIGLPEECRAEGSTVEVVVAYATNPTASALQWLSPEQTADKEHPYVFTQCQAIHARSLLPCADAPGSKVTYDARVRVPSWATALMSAVRDESRQETAEDGYAVFFYKQEVPISTYLIALCAAKLESRELSERCRVWCEPSMVDACAYEFADTEVFLSHAEDILTPYQWGRYDLICMPPSFPYGGMENPCLTFVTPTLLAGDRSLADVVAHEIAHSWTGNLVTNRTWEHFWLNEGWTMWVQRKIMTRIHGEAFFEFDATLGLTHLKNDMAEYGLSHPFTRLIPPLQGEDPDDAFSGVPYEKGFNFLYYLEKLVGSAPFASFAKAYVTKYSRRTLTSLDFKTFFLDHFSAPEYAEQVGQVDWEAWMLQPGALPVAPKFDDSMIRSAHELAASWVSGASVSEDMSGWTSAQRVAFLDHLLLLLEQRGAPLDHAVIKRMDELYGLTASRNAELRHRWCQLLLGAEYEPGVALTVKFVTEQGRMKFVRPLYKALFGSRVGRGAALRTFAEYRGMYHPIATKMIAADLSSSSEAVLDEHIDHSTLANTLHAVTSHISLDWSVDFETKVITGSACLKMKLLKSAFEIVLDSSSDMRISAVSIAGAAVPFTVRPPTPPFGSAVDITLPEGSREEGSSFDILVSYSTSPSASAIQWLSPAQTADKAHPYMFTQCQAIHARSLLPCADTPGLKVTYDARVRVPSWATALMSAVRDESRQETAEDGYAVFFYKQDVPVPTYLIALCAAQLESRELSERCRVWCEPSMVDACAYEFADTEVFLSHAEDILTPYQWGRYDLICMPPSFPYGGMENPCLTFVTPTLLAGDRSLADVVAHEIAHSWTGNLVTNHTWEHFWLNEGWTTFVQRKIMGRFHGQAYFDFDGTLGLTRLKAELDRYGLFHPFTAMVPPLKGEDPDDAFSALPYEKGFNFLCYLEKLVGSAPFASFAKAYVTKYSRRTLTSLDFKTFFLDHFSAPEYAEQVGQVDWEAWMLQPGALPVAPKFDDSMIRSAHELAASWVSGASVSEDMSGWTSAQRVAFLDHLLLLLEQRGAPLDHAVIKRMDELYGLTASRNAELRHRWCQLLLGAEYEPGVALTVKFVTEQGRMKFVRVLYKLLFASRVGREAAVRTFEEHRDMYHPIASKMIAADFASKQGESA